MPGLNVPATTPDWPVVTLHGGDPIEPDHISALFNGEIAGLRIAGAFPAEACAEVLALRDPGAPGGLDPSFATAVLLREHGVRELLSTDPGMRRWRFLDVRDPLKGEPWSPGARPARRYRMLARKAPARERPG